MIDKLYAYLCVRDAKAAIDFYGRAFGAEEIFRLNEPGSGRIGHAELRFGSTVVSAPAACTTPSAMNG